jgi:hypothetical protein
MQGTRLSGPSSAALYLDELESQMKIVPRSWISTSPVGKNSGGGTFGAVRTKQMQKKGSAPSSTSKVRVTTVERHILLGGD